MNNAQTRRATAGLCVDCGKPRAPDGTTTRCRPCAKKVSAAASQWKSRKRGERLAKRSLPNSTKRAYLSKKRRKLGLRSIPILVSEEALDSLVKLAFLEPDQRASRAAISDALAQFAYAKLVRDYEFTKWAIAARAERQQRRPPRNTTRPPAAPVTPRCRSHPTCPQCGNAFRPRKAKKFCSPKCRKRAENHRAYARRATRQRSLNSISTPNQTPPKNPPQTRAHKPQTPFRPGG